MCPLPYAEYVFFESGVLVGAGRWGGGGGLHHQRGSNEASCGRICPHTEKLPRISRCAIDVTPPTMGPQWGLSRIHARSWGTVRPTRPSCGSVYINLFGGSSYYADKGEKWYGRTIKKEEPTSRAEDECIGHSNLLAHSQKHRPQER